MSKLSDRNRFLPADHYIHGYSHEAHSWCVFKKETAIEARLMWRCHNKKAAQKLADEVNSGAAICKGSKELGTECNKCIKCELTQ